MLSFLIIFGISKKKKLYRMSGRSKKIKHLEFIETKSEALCYQNDLVNLSLSLAYHNS